MLILSVILKLSTVQVDYKAAFVHAPIHKDQNWDSLSHGEEKKKSWLIDVISLTTIMWAMKSSNQNTSLAN
jgi:hypothetical protein